MGDFNTDPTLEVVEVIGQAVSARPSNCPHRSYLFLRALLDHRLLLASMFKAFGAGASDSWTSREEAQLGKESPLRQFDQIAWDRSHL